MNQPKKLQYLKMRQTPTPEPMMFVIPEHLRGSYCVQQHNAKRAGWHEDFRFELNGVAISWAIRKGLPKKGDPARLGIRTEDHPVPYMEWSGTIPAGSYGAGDVKLVDRGRCEVIEFSDDKIKVRLSGGDTERAGVYSLMKQDDGKGWLIVHKKTEE